ncbi:three component ABC system middle component [Sinorhizobium meliloti]|uniref:three component ABC system middle component n=1 Tax=Rhizobium meliloti TaxID=382 RepID=UPI0009B79DBF|nr:three component ABC system middle component [Sinorhizobium meliloti]
MASRWSLAWRDRPSEEAALLNPAFCGELIARAVKDYERIRASAFPLPLAFVVLPLLLHPPTLAVLPGRANTTFATWSAENEAVIAELPDRTLRLRPISREALLFLAQHKALVVGAEGLRTGQKPMKLSAQTPTSTPDVDDIRRAAALLGRWFANQGAPVQILQTMGVTP